jgi:hypothetical protein
MTFACRVRRVDDIRYKNGGKDNFKCLRHIIKRGYAFSPSTSVSMGLTGITIPLFLHISRHTWLAR